MDDMTRHFYAQGKGGDVPGRAQHIAEGLWSKAMPQHQQKLNIFAQKRHG
jgi:hypothetical protein